MAGTIVHVLNRAVKRAILFVEPGDYDAFIRVMREALARHPVRILAFCVMPNHWHMVIWSRSEGDVARFLQWLTMTHARRWNIARGLRGVGAVYQGRYRSFPVQSDGHLSTVLRYVERNALRASLVARAESWQWGSLSHRLGGDRLGLLADGPLPLPNDWVRLVNEPETEAELRAVRQCARRGSPLGAPDWVRATAAAWGLEATLGPLGRPRKHVPPDMLAEPDQVVPDAAETTPEVISPGRPRK